MNDQLTNENIGLSLEKKKNEEIIFALTEKLETDIGNSESAKMKMEVDSYYENVYLFLNFHSYLTIIKCTFHQRISN